MAEPSTMDINIPFPDSEGLELRISAGACRLRVGPGKGEEWVTGRYDDPSGTVPLKVEQEGGTVRISQEKDISGTVELARETPTLELELGKAKSYELSVDTGASPAEVELGGVPILRLRSRLGAGSAKVRFAEPNPVEMRLLQVTSGAAAAELHGLGNANAAEIVLEGGAGTQKADFSGQLARDSSAQVTGSAGTVTVVVPADTAARIATSTTLGSLDVGDSFTKREGAFWTEAALAGDGPTLRIEAKVRLGKLTIAVA